ncbi:hypothetical protein Tco_1098765 [Tanacetum coccineum]
MESCDPVDTPMVEKSKLDEDTQGKAVDPTHYRGMFCICLMCPISSKPMKTRKIRLNGSFDNLREPFNKGPPVFKKDTVIVLKQIMHMQSRGVRHLDALTDYGFQFNKIPLYCDNKSAIALCCNNVQHSRAKHIDVRYHFIKEQGVNGIVEPTLFGNTESQQADIFTKPSQEKDFNFLIETLC